ncbi:MAG TPA: hypothetical protein VI953_01770 [Candidatus Paceibacterota bacterium]
MKLALAIVTILLLTGPVVATAQQNVDNQDTPSKTLPGDTIADDKQAKAEITINVRAIEAAGTFEEFLAIIGNEKPCDEAKLDSAAITKAAEDVAKKDAAHDKAKMDEKVKVKEPRANRGINIAW